MDIIKLETILLGLNKGYVSGESLINSALNVRRNGVDDLENIENYSWLDEIKEDIDKTFFMAKCILEFGSNLNYIGFLSSFILNPIDTYKGLYYYKKKKSLLVNSFFFLYFITLTFIKAYLFLFTITILYFY